MGSPETSRTITDVVEAAFFDLDKTVISKSSSLALSRPMYRAGMVTRSQLLKGAYAQLVYLLVGADDRRMERAKEGILAITKGWDREQVEKLARESIEKVLDPFIYQEALDLIALHHALGRSVYIVSSSPEEVVRPLVERLGADGVIATRAESVDGKYTGKLEFYCYGEQKADAVRNLAEREGIDLSNSYAYSDSATDLPLLEAVGSPVAVNPDRELRKIAEHRNWKVRHFRNPIPLRRRIHVPPPSRAITAAAAGGAIAAALGWIYGRRGLARLAASLRRRSSGFPWATLRD
jgi:HAD superfamily hydrolase (TIGR01490 family)